MCVWVSQLLLMAGTPNKLVEYLTSTHARGVLCEAPKSSTETVMQRKIGKGNVTVESNEFDYSQVRCGPCPFTSTTAPLSAALSSSFFFILKKASADHQWSFLDGVDANRCFC